MNKILSSYLNIEVERLTSNVINKSINNRIAGKNYKDFLIISRNSDGSIENISYDTLNISDFTRDISAYLQDVLIDLDGGNVNNLFISKKISNSKFKDIKSGILLGVSLGSINHSTLFASLGPIIPIKLVFTGQINTDLDIKVHEYGLNSIMVEIFLVIDIHEVTAMPLTSKEKKITIREPVSIDIIQGKIPSYYNLIK